MPGEVALLAPLDRQEAVELSSTLWRKQLLPRGTIDYKGRKISFDDKYLADLAASFRANAFDQVAFLLAKDDNSHTMDPERFRGEVKGMEVTSSGLDVLLDLTEDAADLVRKNPRLGVSARIIEGLNRADGTKFPRAIQHVLGTLDPRVTGMASWQEVSLSEEVGDTVDMTTEEVQMSQTQGETTVVETTPSSDTDPPEHPEPNTVPGAPDLSNSPTEDEILMDLVPDQPVVDPNLLRIEELELKLARQEFAAEARQWIDKGVPPTLVMLAKPVLELPQAPVIDLSNHGGDTIDVAKVLRDMLEETTGFIEMATERGAGFSDKDSEADREAALLDAWAKQ
jgi:hypothetical protein